MHYVNFNLYERNNTQMDITKNNALIILEKYLKKPSTMNKYEHSLRVSRHMQGISKKMERIC